MQGAAPGSLLADRHPLRRLFPPVALAGFALMVFLPVLAGGYFGDDWVLLLPRPERSLAEAWRSLHPYRFWRPAQLALVAASKLAFGETTVPVHLLQLALHLGLALLTVRAAGALGASGPARWLGGLFVAVAQVGAAAVGGNDTISQQLAVLCGSISCWSLLRWRDKPRRPGLALLAFAGGLLSKEVALGYLPLLLVLGFRPMERGKSSWRQGVPAAIGLVLLTAAYLAWRDHLGAVRPDSRDPIYGIELGTNLVRHLLMQWGAALLPVSTAWEVAALANREWLWVGLGLAAGLGFVAALAVGLAGAGRLRLAGRVALAATTCLGPALVIRHTSELYAYALLPFLGVLVALAEPGTSAPPVRRLLTGAAVALVLALNALAANAKARAMAENGERAAAQLREVLPHARKAPPGTWLVLLEARGDHPYSVFRVPGLRLVSDEALRVLANRPDLVVHRGDPRARAPAPPPGSTVLELEDDGTRAEPVAYAP